jgi:hypothetical protein
MTRLRRLDTVGPMFATGKGLAAAALSLVLGAAAACGDDGDEGAAWELVHQQLPGALLSVWGTGADDIWTVGSDPDGEGPAVMHYDGAEWEDLDTGTAGDLWWVFGPERDPGGTVYMGGAGGTILAYRDGTFTPMETPRTDVTVFGIWGCSPEDMWAVGGALGGASGGFAWRLQPASEDEDARWVEADGFPAEIAADDAVWKAFGRSCDDVWLVGTDGLAVHWDGQAFTDERAGGESLFTVHASADRFAAVGGFGTGTLLENDGSGWVDVSPDDASPLVGVCLTGSGGVAVGQYGTVIEREGSGPGAAWTAADTGLFVDQTMHSVWIDPDGGVWAVGGQVLNAPFVDGLMLHRESQ